MDIRSLPGRSAALALAALTLALPAAAQTGALGENKFQFWRRATCDKRSNQGERRIVEVCLK